MPDDERHAIKFKRDGSCAGLRVPLFTDYAFHAVLLRLKLESHVFADSSLEHPLDGMDPEAIETEAKRLLALEEQAGDDFTEDDDGPDAEP